MGKKCSLRRMLFEPVRTGMGVLSWTEDFGEEMFNDFNMSKLRIDQAYLNISSAILRPHYLYSVYKECAQCPYTKEQVIDDGDILVIDTRYPKTYRVASDNVPILQSNSSVICDVDPNFGEFGVYNLRITNSSSCYMDTLKEPVNIYFPILTVFLIYAAVMLFASSFLYVLNVYTKKIERQTTSYDLDPKQSKKNSRIVSLDTFRGISVVLMIFANFGSGGYVKLQHSVWNGLQFSDLLFPWFLWIMGVCIPISTSSVIKKGVSRKSALINITRRSCILFGLGLFLNSGQYLDTLRVFAILQRFGVCYLVVAVSFMLTPAGLGVSEYGIGQKDGLVEWKDLLALKSQWMIAIAIVIAHNLLTFLMHAPNCTRGYLGPGGLHQNGTHLGCTGGAAGYIDKLILGNHIYQYPEIRTIYKADAFDPEGILGFLTSILQVFIGSQAGATIIFYKSHVARLTRWVVWGVVLGLVGGFLCGFSKEDGLIPVNKNLWSLSFVLATSSLAFLLFSMCYVLIDVKKFWSGKPFVFAGMNAIVMYVGHSIAFNNFPIRWVPNQGEGFSTHFVMLIENVWGTGIWLLIAYQLYRINFFLTI